MEAYTYKYTRIYRDMAEEKIKKDMEENAETKNIIEDLIARIRA